MALQELQLKITGMTCGHCEKSVHNEIASLDGIQEVSIELKSGTGIVVFDNAKVSVEQIVDSVNALEVYQAQVLPN